MIPIRPRSARRPGLAPLAGVLLLLVLAGLPMAGGARATSAPAPAPAPSSARLLHLQDSKNLTRLVGTTLSTLTDTLTVPKVPLAIRSYTIRMSASLAIPTVAVLLQTLPAASWGGPDQFPYGPDNLPPIAEWTWWVRTGAGMNDTANWTVDPDGTHLDRLTTWSTRTFVVSGTSAPVLTVGIDPSNRTGGSAVGTGFVLNAPGYRESIPTTPGYPHLAEGTHPALVRICLGIPGALTAWNRTSHQPVFNFKGLDQEFRFVEALHAQVLLSFPAGTWGDGNSLPNGTPVNHSAPMVYGGASGYFPGRAAMYAIVRGVANHTAASNESVAYWSIGNEVPLYSTTEAIAFATILNVAIVALHPLYPKALVGADDMLLKSYLALFAQRSPQVGFLSFHWYPEWAICQTPNGTYCLPRGGNFGLTTPSLFANEAFQNNYRQIAPQVAVDAWRNATGRTLPVVLAETNMAASGGIGTRTQAIGTDPRQQTLVGAAWLGSLLVDASTENLSAITYFGLTSAAVFPAHTSTYPYGGFGFGLTNESPAGATTRFAPYWAMSLWGKYLPAGAPALAVTDPFPTTVRAYAVQDGRHVDVALVNRVPLNVTVHLAIPRAHVLRSTRILDDRSYVERYNPAQHATSVLASGVALTKRPRSDTLTLDGYGMAIAVFGHHAKAKGAAGAPPPGSRAPAPGPTAAWTLGSRAPGPLPALSALGGPQAIRSPRWTVPRAP